MPKPVTDETVRSAAVRLRAQLEAAKRLGYYDTVAVDSASLRCVIEYIQRQRRREMAEAIDYAEQHDTDEGEAVRPRPPRPR